MSGKVQFLDRLRRKLVQKYVLQSFPCAFYFWNFMKFASCPSHIALMTVLLRFNNHMIVHSESLSLPLFYSVYLLNKTKKKGKMLMELISR